MYFPDRPEQLLVDVNRDRLFQEAEILQTSAVANVWFVEIDAEYLGTPSYLQPQQVRIERDANTGIFTLATAGRMAGTTAYGGNTCQARYEDRNANGSWFDAEDRLFVDLNADGKLDSLMERLPCDGMRKIRGGLHAIEGDTTGRTVRLREVHDKGSIVPLIRLKDVNAIIKSINASICSESGIRISIKNLLEPVDVPVGKWSVKNVEMEVVNEDGVFLFVFDASSTNANPVEVLADESQEMELIGTLKLSASVATFDRNGTQTITITPSLTTSTGCYLISSKCGTNSPHEENRLVARSKAIGKEFALGSSGFS